MANLLDRKRIFIFSVTSGIGDMIMAIPMLRLLHQKILDADITLGVLSEGARQLFETCPFIRRVIKVETKGHHLMRRNLKLLLEVRRDYEFDLCMTTCITGYFYLSIDSIIANCMRAKRRIGFLLPTTRLSFFPFQFLRLLLSAVSVIQLIPILMAGVFVNNTTPMSRAGGEIVRVYGLREKFKLPYTIAILSVALSKLTEIVPVGLMGIIGVFVLAQSRIISWQQLKFIGMIGCFVVGIATWGIYKKHCLPTLWSKFIGYLLRKERLGLKSQSGSSNQLTIEETTWSIKQKKAFGESLLFSSALWGLALVRLKVLAYALGIDLSFSVAAAVTVWYIAIGFISFTPGGIGIIEGGLAAGFVFMGVSSSQAFALTVLERAISYLLTKCK